MEKTVIIFKPDAIEQRIVGRVLSRFETAGFRVIGCKMVQFTPELLRTHYAHIVDHPCYPGLTKFMGSSHVILMALQGENVVRKVRELLGPTDSRTAPKGTIRGDYGTDSMKNILHASDSVENGLVELERFFKPGELSV
jgi:nucleoside-diphosphate kinase